MAEAPETWFPGDGSRTGHYEYPLPGDRIARYPADRRDRSRLLVADRGTGEISDRRFRDLAELIPAGDALVLNDTRVIPARLRGEKPTGAACEVFLLRPLPDDPGDDPGFGTRWKALVRPGGKLKRGRTVVVSPDLRVEIEDFAASCWSATARRRSRPTSTASRSPGTGGATRPSTPTGTARGASPPPRRVSTSPTSSWTASGRRASSWPGSPCTWAWAPSGRWTPTGRTTPSSTPSATTSPRRRGEPSPTSRTTRPPSPAKSSISTRVLETVVDRGTGGTAARYRPGRGETDLFIHPPYRFRGVDRLITNFHLPRSSLLMLVSAFAGRAVVEAAYRHAVAGEYRFYSYGDACLFL